MPPVLTELTRERLVSRWWMYTFEVSFFSIIVMVCIISYNIYHRHMYVVLCNTDHRNITWAALIALYHHGEGHVRKLLVTWGTGVFLRDLRLRQSVAVKVISCFVHSRWTILCVALRMHELLFGTIQHNTRNIM